MWKSSIRENHSPRVVETEIIGCGTRREEQLRGGGMYTVKVWERHLTAKVSDRYSLETTGLHDSGISHVITCLLQLTFLDVPACLRIPFIRLPGPNFNNQVTPFYWTQSFITAITKARHLSLLIRSRHCIHIPLLENIKLTVWTECVRVGRALSFSLKKRKETQRKKKKGTADVWGFKNELLQLSNPVCVSLVQQNCVNEVRCLNTIQWR